mgnify:CR=1 FL=1
MINPDCQTTSQTDISTVDFNLSIANMSSNQEAPKLLVNIGPESVDYFGFVRDGWRSENGESRNVKEVIVARSVEIQPKAGKNEEWLSIDNENYELKPIKVTLLPKLIKVFCTKENEKM